MSLNLNWLLNNMQDSVLLYETNLNKIVLPLTFIYWVWELKIWDKEKDKVSLPSILFEDNDNKFKYVNLTKIFQENGIDNLDFLLTDNVDDAVSYINEIKDDYDIVVITKKWEYYLIVPLLEEDRLEIDEIKEWLEKYIINNDYVSKVNIDILNKNFLNTLLVHIDNLYTYNVDFDYIKEDIKNWLKKIYKFLNNMVIKNWIKPQKFSLINKIKNYFSLTTSLHPVVEVFLHLSSYFIYNTNLAGSWWEKDWMDHKLFSNSDLAKQLWLSYSMDNKKIICYSWTIILNLMLNMFWVLNEMVVDATIWLKDKKVINKHVYSFQYLPTENIIFFTDITYWIFRDYSKIYKKFKKEKREKWELINEWRNIFSIKKYLD